MVVIVVVMMVVVVVIVVAHALQDSRKIQVMSRQRLC